MHKRLEVEDVSEWRGLSAPEVAELKKIPTH
jgi:hypothetical protein